MTWIGKHEDTLQRWLQEKKQTSVTL